MPAPEPRRPKTFRRTNAIHFLLLLMVSKLSDVSGLSGLCRQHTVAALQDLKRFQSQKVNELRSLLLQFAQTNVESCDQALSTWTLVREAASA
eukprot:m.570501 g.570501  ORF g.570501 m.570501 type:complete len:93 (-) comp57852_c0_seq25:1690-1968(-)